MKHVRGKLDVCLVHVVCGKFETPLRQLRGTHLLLHVRYLKCEMTES